MAFQQTWTWGEHSIYTFDTEKHKFKEFFQDLYEYKSLESLHLISTDYKKHKDNTESGVLSDVDTDLHRKFYTNIKSKPHFKKLYCELIRDIHQKFFPNEKALVYQSFPSIRIQFMNSVAIPPHADSDSIGNHPLGEKNFILPLTRMKNTNRLFIESEPGKKDFQGIDIEYGKILFFNGNTCVHYNEKNTEDFLRISLDFRVMIPSDYFTYTMDKNITTTNPRDKGSCRQPQKMTIGSYYQVYFPNRTLEDMMIWYNNKNPIIQSRPNFCDEETEAVMTYMKQDSFITEFKETTRFEQLLSDYMCVKHCITTTSGTTALVLALQCLNIGEGDEVIVPNYTMIATANSVKSVGAKVVLADVLPTYSLSLAEVKKRTTPKTRAIIHVSVNNECADLESIAKFCKENVIFLIEDAAQSVGFFYKEKHLGTYGDIGCFSLSTPKIISTGQGGFIISNSDEIAANARKIKNFGRIDSGSDNYVCFGLNYKFTDIQAIIGIQQLKKLDERVKRLTVINSLYHKYLGDVVEIHTRNGQLPWFVCIICKNRQGLSTFLNSHNVQVRLTYPRLSDTPMYYIEEEFPNSTRICSKGVYLPTHMLLKDADIFHICNLIRYFYQA